MLSTPVISDLDITPLCEDTCSECSVNQYGGAPNCNLGYGMQLYQYEYTLDASTLKNAGCCMVRFYWTSCCRNDEIDNIQNPMAQSIYMYGEVDICDSQGVNGPMFTTSSYPIFYAGEDVSYSLGLVDPDHDSLVVSLAHPLNGGPTNANPSGSFTLVPYVSGYSPTKPLKFLGWPNADLSLPYGFHLDSLTGDLQFRPTQPGGYVVRFEVKKYRQGQLVGRTQRELIVWVISSTADAMHPPKLTGIDSTSGYSITAYEGQQKCFNVYSYDVDTADSLTLSWNAGISGATFTVTDPSVSQTLTTEGPAGQFCWTPPAGSASSVPYLFTVTVSDDHCPYRLQWMRTYRVYVNPSPVMFNDSVSLCRGDTVWIGPTPYTQAGMYSDTLTTSGGYDSIVTLYVTVVNVDTGVVVSGDTLMAVQDSAVYQWLDCANNMAPIAGATGRQFVPSGTGFYAVKVTYQGCEATSGCYPVVLTGIGTVAKAFGLRIYPNPTRGMLYFDAVRPGAYTLRLYDLMGKEYLRRQITITQGYALDLSQLSKGMYFLEVADDDKVEVVKVIVK